MILNLQLRMLICNIYNILMGLLAVITQKPVALIRSLLSCNSSFFLFNGGHPHDSMQDILERVAQIYFVSILM